MLNQKRLKELASYDKETGIFIWGPFTGNARRIAAATRKQEIMLDGEIYKFHDLAWLFVYGELPKYSPDHANNVETDNRICNLKEALSIVKKNDYRARCKYKIWDGSRCKRPVENDGLLCSFHSLTTEKFQMSDKDNY